MSEQHYPSLFIVFSGEKASFWRLDEDSVTEIASVIAPPGRASDHDGAFMKPGQYEGGVPDTLSDRHEDDLRHHVKAVAEKAGGLCQQETYKHLSCTATKMHIHLVAEALASHCPGMHPKVIPGDYVHAPKDQIRDLFRKTLQTV